VCVRADGFMCNAESLMKISTGVKPILKYNLGYLRVLMLVLLKESFMKCVLEGISDGTINLPSFIKTCLDCR
jgi:hypothetical protein